MNLDELDDHALIRHARSETGEEHTRALQTLYRRHYDRVGRWCLASCRDREEAAELAQEVFVKVHNNLDNFQQTSRFTTWLYRITRNLAVDRARRQALRTHSALEHVPEPIDPQAPVDVMLGRHEVVERFKASVARDLQPLEARVLYLHYVDGMPLAALTELLALDNKSGAKAYIVSGRRKLGRTFGRWLHTYRTQPMGGLG